MNNYLYCIFIFFTCMDAFFIYFIHLLVAFNQENKIPNPLLHFFMPEGILLNNGIPLDHDGRFFSRHFTYMTAIM